MKIKSYHIASPEQLNELGVFAKDTERLKQIRSVWSIALRKKGKTPWDHAIFAEFYSYGSLYLQGTVYQVSGTFQSTNTMLH